MPVHGPYSCQLTERAAGLLPPTWLYRERDGALSRCGPGQDALPPREDVETADPIGAGFRFLGVSDRRRICPRTTMARSIRLWWHNHSARNGRLSALSSLGSVLWEFLLDSMPERRRRRYGDIEFDWNHRVDNTQRHSRLAGPSSGSVSFPLPIDRS